MKIKNGVLKSINTHSGPYQPSLYSIALFLRYLKQTEYLQIKVELGKRFQIEIKDLLIELQNSEEPNIQSLIQQLEKKFAEFLKEHKSR
ncbi:MAG: hypothetical protein HYX60_09810 [Legionella longbeachae]|nr:hypothetical protein [Legionella longbeachae]